MKLRLLIVEDDPLLAETIQDYFSSKDWQTHIAADGEEALNLLRGKRQKKKQPYVKPIIVGFCALYLASMLISTYMMHLRYTKTYNLNAQTQTQKICDFIQNISADYNWDGKELSENQQGFLRYALSFRPEMYDKYQPFSMALYDYNGNLAAQTCNLSTTQTAIPITSTNNQEDPYLFYCAVFFFVILNNFFLTFLLFFGKIHLENLFNGSIIFHKK